MHAHGLENQAIEIVAQALCTDEPSTFESKSPMEVVGYAMTKNCADKVFRKAGFEDGEGRDQVGVIELHDCFSANEVCVLHAMCRALSDHLLDQSLWLTRPWACAVVVKLTRSLKGATAP